MPRVKRDPHDWPSLNDWLHSLGISDRQIRKNFLYSALVNYFPGAQNGSHIIPSREEIIKDRNRLARTITDFHPDIVVPVGRLSIAYCLVRPIGPLEENIGLTYVVDPYGLLGRELLVIPLPHPSGASTWRRRPEGEKLLPQALQLLKDNLEVS